MNRLRNYTLPTNYNKLAFGEKAEVREQYIKEQKGKCYYCNKELNELPSKEVLKKEINWSLFPKNFRDHGIHLQHSHKTHMTEGAVHAYCNAVLWQYENR